MRRLAVVSVTALVLAACLPGTVPPVPAESDVAATTSPPPTADPPDPPPPVCRRGPVTGTGVELLRFGDPVRRSVAVSARMFSCADRVVIVPADDYAAMTAAAPVAADMQAPLLLTRPGAGRLVAAEVARLGATEVVTVGDPAPLPPGVPAEAMRLRPGGVADTLARLAGLDGAAPHELAAALAARPPTGGPVVVAPVTDPAGALPAAVAAAVTGGRLLLADPSDVWGDATFGMSLRAARPDQVVLVGLFDGDVLRQVETVLTSEPLPGGGWRLLPGRRLVALYGNPLTPNLGVLGEQGPEESIERLRPLVEAYGVDGVPTVPAFDIIATVADARPGADGDYSAETPIEVLEPWVDAARRAGVYVILDLQPGRTDFLTQARRYEELLRQPHVGLALDPEWRLRPDQVHLRQIGSVDAAEVNEVAGWLAELVRRERLPQKLLLIHQFKPSMITNRERIVTPPELAVVIQMDGQGPLATKYSSYRVITGNRPHPRWWWGWKNFYDEDSPVATPEQVLGLEPVPVFVSFQ